MTSKRTSRPSTTSSPMLVASILALPTDLEVNQEVAIKKCQDMIFENLFKKIAKICPFILN